MSNMIVYDLETSSGNKNWSQVLQIGMILVNEKLQELAREEITCKLSPTVIPDPGALMTNNISSKDLREKNLSEHGMVKLFIQTIKNWGKITTIGWNSTNFDRHVMRSTLWRQLVDEGPYLLNSNGNQEADLMHVARSSYLF